MVNASGNNASSVGAGPATWGQYKPTAQCTNEPQVRKHVLLSCPLVEHAVELEHMLVQRNSHAAVVDLDHLASATAGLHITARLINGTAATLPANGHMGYQAAGKTNMLASFYG